MIKSLSIQNYQSHKDTHLEFNKGVNIIIGASDSGKSAILRALRWLAWNRPSGDAMRSHWGGKTRVELFTDNVHLVRSKDKEEEYILGDTHFKAFRTEVPKEIQDVLNITEVNLQRQLDAPFLLSNTPGEVASYFNRIARLDKIDSGTQNINSAIRTLTQTISLQEDQVKVQSAELSKFDHLEKFEVDLEVLEDMDKRYVNKLRTETKLETLIGNIKDTEADIEEASGILVFEKDVDSLLGKYREKEEVFHSYLSLQSSIDDLVDVGAEMDQQKKLIDLEDKVDFILNLYNNKKTAEYHQILLFKVLSVISNTSIRLERESRNLSGLQAEFEEGMGDVCILCGQPIKK